MRDRPDGEHLAAELRRLLEAHREAGSELAARLLAERHSIEDDIWLVEPIVVATPVVEPTVAPPAPARVAPVRIEAAIEAPAETLG